MNSGHNRVRPTLRVVAFILSFISLSIGIGILATATSPTAMAYFAILSLLIPIFLTILFRRLLDKKTVASLGLSFKKGWARNLLTGTLMAIFLVTVVFLVQLLGGWISVQNHFGLDVFNPLFLATFLMVLMGSLGAAVSEELVFRGYILQNLEEGWGILVAMITASLLFGFAHFFNPNFSWLVGLNLALAGLFLAYGYFVTGSLWLPIGFHLSWNFFEGYVFGLPVSGLSTNMVSLLVSKPQGPNWLTGGVFGPEGGLLATFAYLIGFLFLWFISTKWTQDSA